MTDDILITREYLQHDGYYFEIELADKPLTWKEILLSPFFIIENRVMHIRAYESDPEPLRRRDDPRWGNKDERLEPLETLTLGWNSNEGPSHSYEYQLSQAITLLCEKLSQEQPDPPVKEQLSQAVETVQAKL